MHLFLHSFTIPPQFVDKKKGRQLSQLPALFHLFAKPIPQPQASHKTNQACSQSPPSLHIRIKRHHTSPPPLPTASVRTNKPAHDSDHNKHNYLTGQAQRTIPSPNTCKKVPHSPHKFHYNHSPTAKRFNSSTQSHNVI